jgi:hypothetical protein
MTTATMLTSMEEVQRIGMGSRIRHSGRWITSRVGINPRGPSNDLGLTQERIRDRHR